MHNPRASCAYRDYRNVGRLVCPWYIRRNYGSKIGNSGFRVTVGAGMRYTYEYLDSNFLESTSFFISRELYLIMEDSHTRYGLIVSVGCGDPGSGNARARAKNHEKFYIPFSQSCLISAPHYGTHHFEARNCVLYAAHSTGGNGYAHNTRAADVSNDQHKSAPDSAPGHANWESTPVFT